MLKQQSKQYLHLKINILQLLRTISDIKKRTCIVNNMVRDSCTTNNKWHQSTTLIWYDCPIYVEKIVLIILLRHSIRHDGIDQRRKDMNAQLTL